MKFDFANIFEAIIDYPVKAGNANYRANVLAAVRGLMVACKWEVQDKIYIYRPTKTLL